MAVHAPDALRILGNQATFDELRILGAFQYIYRYLFSVCICTSVPRFSYKYWLCF